MSLYQWKFCNKEGGVVGLMIDSSNKLHFYFDGKDIDTVTEKVSGPRYAIFKFNHRWKVDFHSRLFWTILASVKRFTNNLHSNDFPFFKF